MLLLEVMWQTGGRVSEVIILTPERIGSTSIVLVNLKQSKRIKIGNKTTKVRDVDAIKEVEISESLCDRIKTYCKEHKIIRGDYIFPGNWNTQKHLTRQYVHEIVTKASENAQIFKRGKRNPRVGVRFKGAYPHIFRHSSAMMMLEETGNIMLVKQQLGHSSVSATQIYAFVKETNIKKAISKINW